MIERTASGPDDETRLAISVFGSEIRCAILHLLHTDALASKAHLADQLGTRPETLRYHLDALEAAGAIYTDQPGQRQGQRVVYHLDARRVTALHRALGRYLHTR